MNRLHGRGADHKRRRSNRSPPQSLFRRSSAVLCLRRRPRPRRGAAHTVLCFGAARRSARQTAPTGRARWLLAHGTATNRFLLRAGSRANRHTDAGPASRRRAVQWPFRFRRPQPAKRHAAPARAAARCCAVSPVRQNPRQGARGGQAAAALPSHPCAVCGHTTPKSRPAAPPVTPKRPQTTCG